jgi:hypothetical protein
MHVGDRVQHKATKAIGRVAGVPPRAPAGAFIVYQTDHTMAVWSADDTALLKAIADVIAEQEKKVQANTLTAQQAPTEENIATLESSQGQLEQFRREARGMFREA